MSKITNQMLLDAINGVNSQLNNLKVEVETLRTDVDTLKGVKGKSAKPSQSGKGSTEKAIKLLSTKVEDYEPKKDDNGNYIWQSYKKNRTRFCYAIATNGKAYGCYDKDGNKVADFDDIKTDYEKAKAKFEKKFKYIKKADR